MLETPRSITEGVSRGLNDNELAVEKFNVLRVSKLVV